MTLCLRLYALHLNSSLISAGLRERPGFSRSIPLPGEQAGTVWPPSMLAHSASSTAGLKHTVEHCVVARGAVLRRRRRRDAQSSILELELHGDLNLLTDLTVRGL